jgi:hypothetical protein
MALSATFTANFASFYDAVAKAEVTLKDFGAGADKVGGRLNALANSFSGQKIIQDATLMAKKRWRGSARRPTKPSRR